jgi:hypothetical protein
MKPFAIAGFLALGCLGCAERHTGGSLVALYNYNAFTCRQLQEEAISVSLEATAALGRPSRRAPRADPDTLLVVSWPDPSAAGSAKAPDLKARMVVIERTARAKSCAIRFQPDAAEAQ